MRVCGNSQQLGLFLLNALKSGSFVADGNVRRSCFCFVIKLCNLSSTDLKQRCLTKMCNKLWPERNEEPLIITNSGTRHDYGGQIWVCTGLGTVYTLTQRRGFTLIPVIYSVISFTLYLQEDKNNLIKTGLWNLQPSDQMKTVRLIKQSDIWRRSCRNRCRVGGLMSVK